MARKVRFSPRLSQSVPRRQLQDRAFGLALIVTGVLCLPAFAFTGGDVAAHIRDVMIFAGACGVASIFGGVHFLAGA